MLKASTLVAEADWIKREDLMVLLVGLGGDEGSLTYEAWGEDFGGGEGWLRANSDKRKTGNDKSKNKRRNAGFLPIRLRSGSEFRMTSIYATAYVSVRLL